MFDEYNDYEEETQMESNSEYLEEMKDHLARANWKAIKENGIDAYGTIQINTQIDTIKEIIQETLQYFEEIEEYEKCADLKRALDQL